MSQKMTWADAHEFFEERSALREHDGGEPRAEAERQAVAELYDTLLGNTHGIVAELYRAVRIKMRPDLAPILKAAGLPTGPDRDWGLDWVTFADGTFRPSDPNEKGDPGLVIGIRDNGGLLFDLVAHSLAERSTATRLGVGDLLGTTPSPRHTQANSHLSCTTTRCRGCRTIARASRLPTGDASMICLMA